MKFMKFLSQDDVVKREQDIISKLDKTMIKLNNYKMLDKYI